MTIKRAAYVAGIGVLLLGASCAANPEVASLGNEPPRAETVGVAETALAGDAYDSVRAACKGTYENHGACTACVAHVQPGGDVVSDFAKGECKTGCIKTSCTVEGKTCGSIDDGCGGTISCGPPCVERKTFAVTCLQRTVTCAGPSPDTTSAFTAVVDLYPEVPSTPNLVTIYGSVATGTVLVSPDFSAIVGQVSPTAILTGHGQLDGAGFSTPPSRFFVNFHVYFVNRSTMTFSSTSTFVHRGGLTPDDPCAFLPAVSSVQKWCTGAVVP